jgi:hypothetical protein
MTEDALKRMNRQAGYLYEVPLIVMATIALLAIILPHLPVSAKKVVVIASGIVVAAGLYYVLVIPGWQGNARRLRRPWSVILFVIIALLIALGIANYVIDEQCEARLENQEAEPEAGQYQMGGRRKAIVREEMGKRDEGRGLICLVLS